jgi:hypothetical protein
MTVKTNLKFLKKNPSNSKVIQTEDEWSWCIGYPFNCTGKGAAMKFLVTSVEFLDEALWVPLLN